MCASMAMVFGLAYSPTKLFQQKGKCVFKAGNGQNHKQWSPGLHAVGSGQGRRPSIIHFTQ